MSKFTDFLNLFMWDSIEDSEEEFNIDKALNDNWKKIDTKVKTHVTSVNEEINNFKEETNQKIENIQALPTGGTKGQVLTKQSETNGDANWEDIEANEVFIGNEEEAPETAKIIVEDEDFEESAGLSKAEIFVGAEEPTAGEKVWFRKVKNVFNFYNIQTKYPNAKLNTKSNNSFSITNIGNWAYALLNLNLKPNTIYTLSADVTNSNGAYCGFYIDNNIDGCKNGDKSFKSAITFTTDETGVQTVFAYVNRSATTTASTYTVTFNNVQLEQGSKATSYEAYIEPQIYVRNSNGVYEEFTKNDNVILYNNVDGSNEDITLNDNSDNYKYIDIYYRQQDGTYSFIRALPNTTVALSAPHVTDNGYAIGWAVRNIKISGNKITTATTNRYLFINVVSTNSLSGASKTNNIYITKVVGYK